MEYDIEKNYRGTIFEVKTYYKKGTNIRHRTDGPAVERPDGYKGWWFNGKPHRLNGPAIEYPNGYKEWWVNGKRLSPEKEEALNRWWKNKNGI